MSRIVLRVNGHDHAVEADPETPLLFVLTDQLGLRGPRFGCGLAECGSCTVLRNGQAIRSCVTAAGEVGTDEIVTLDGLGTPQNPHPIQRAFIEEGASQCGFCLSGVMLTAKAALDANPHATDDEIRGSMNGVLCRCFTHTRMMRAIRKYAEEKKHETA